MTPEWVFLPRAHFERRGVRRGAPVRSPNRRFDMLQLGRVMAFVLVTLGVLPLKAEAWDRGAVKTFAVLPEGSSGPEGLEVDSAGNVYVTTFGFTSAGPASGLGQMFVFDAQGRLLRQLSVAGSSPHLLGLRFHPMTGVLLVNDFGAGQVLAVNPHTG